MAFRIVCLPAITGYFTHSFTVHNFTSFVITALIGAFGDIVIVVNIVCAIYYNRSCAIDREYGRVV